MALEVPLGSLCMVPAWTFVATAHAVVQAGLVPWLVDVDPRDGVLAPAAALRLAAHAPGPLGAVLAVAPFGLPVDVEGWERFRERTGIPVVLDVAAGFDTVRASTIPMAVSLHATKPLGVGEGGFVVWNDADGVREIRRRINFGFAGSREAAVPALNAKLSEYAAAVGLAALDHWPSTRAEWKRTADAYARAIADSRAEIALQPGYGKRWIASTTVVRLPKDRLAAVERALDAEGIGTRRWWGGGLARHAAFAGYPRTALAITDELAASSLGLPCWVDLPEPEIRRIVNVVAFACARVTA
jgi:dTDP-4-amino-4,6-dideoxygalactose transaminase